MATWKSSAALWKKLKPVAREFRSEPTAAEELLWRSLRRKQFRRLRFRRQQAIDRFIVDLFCPDLHLVIEIDGSSHIGRHAEDSERQLFLESRGFKVFRVRNEEISGDLSGVLSALERFIDSHEGKP
jgi:very-short-patch-repair endonuclease